MAADLRSILLVVGTIALIVVALYLTNPSLFGAVYGREGFESAVPGATMGTDSTSSQQMGEVNETPGGQQKKDTTSNPNSAGGDASMVQGFADASGEGFADLSEVTGPASFDSANAPAGCYPRDQLTPGELLPKDANSVWAQQNPMGTGSLKGKNFLSAGALIGINTVGQSLRNANYQLRSEPPNPQVPVSVFNNSTIEPDTNRRDFEVN